jgi:hypothetical protein
MAGRTFFVIIWIGGARRKPNPRTFNLVVGPADKLQFFDNSSPRRLAKPSWHPRVPRKITSAGSSCSSSSFSVPRFQRVFKGKEKLMLTILANGILNRFIDLAF